MSNPISKQQLIDAATDAQTLSDVMNSTADSVTTRLGRSVPTLQKALQLSVGPAGPQGQKGDPGPAGGSPDAAQPINIFDWTVSGAGGQTGTVSSTDGSVSPANWAEVSPFMDLRGATQWTSNIPLAFFAPVGAAYYDANHNFLSGIVGSNSSSAVGQVFNVPAGAKYLRVTMAPGAFQPVGVSDDRFIMILAGPTVPAAYQAYDATSRYGDAGVKLGSGLALAFYRNPGAVVNGSQITSDATGSNLNVPGNAAAHTDTRDMTSLQPSGNTGAGVAVMQRRTTGTIQGPGRNFGNAGGWTTGYSDSSTLDVSQRGIHQLKSFTIQKRAVGDVAGIYGYVRSDGGLHAQSDEGVTGATIEVSENEGYFHGTVAATTGQGDTKPTFAHTTGNPWTTDGAFMLNISKGVYHGNMLSPSVPCAFTTNQGVTASFLPGYLPVTPGSVPVSQAIGIATASPVGPQNAYTVDTPQQVDVTVRLVQIGGSYPIFTVGSYVTVAGDNYPEQAKLLTVVDNHDGTMKLTMKLRNPNNNAVIFQGGVAGQYLSFDANLAFSGMRSTYFAFGSLTGNDLIYGLQVGGGVESDFTLPQAGSEAAVADGGASSGFHLYPGAEVVANADQGFNCTLEQNNVTWAVGDVVENPHFPIFGGTGMWVTRTQESVSSQRAGQTGFALDVGGHGFGGGNVTLMRLQNTNPATYYQAAGGPLSAPNGLVLSGSFHSLITCTRAPQGDGAVFQIFSPAKDNTPALVHFFDINYAGGGNVWFDPTTPTSGTWRTDGFFQAANYKSNDGSLGDSGSFTSADGKTVTVKNGLITRIA